MRAESPGEKQNRGSKESQRIERGPAAAQGHFGSEEVEQGQIRKEKLRLVATRGQEWRREKRAGQTKTGNRRVVIAEGEDHANNRNGDQTCKGESEGEQIVVSESRIDRDVESR